MKYTEPEKILIIRLSSIGDIILATPLIRILRNRFPDAEIDVLIKSRFQELLYTNPHITNLILLDTNKGRSELVAARKAAKNRNYDWIVDIHNNFRSRYLVLGLAGAHFRYKKYRWQRFVLIKLAINLYKSIIPVSDRYINSLKTMGIENDHNGTEFFTDPVILDNIHKELADLGALDHGQVICVAPGAGFPTKRWPLEYYTELVKNLSRSGAVLLVGDDRDKSLTDYIAKDAGENVFDLAGRYSIMQTACILQHADLFIGNDSGLMHLAGALGKKTLVMFGPTTRELGFFPQQPNAVVLENRELGCRPCTHIGSRKCPKKHFKCMLGITPQLVLNEVLELLKENSIAS